MSGARRADKATFSLSLILVVPLMLLAAVPGAAVELWEGRVEFHGFYETQIRGIANDFQASDDWDLTQFAHILNLEIEANLVENGWGAIDLLSAFARVEARYDCVWTRACGLFPNANAFGNRAKKLPRRLNNGRRMGYRGGVFTGDLRHYRGEDPGLLRWIYRNRPDESRRPYGIEGTPPFNILFTSPGADGVLHTADDPSPYYFDRYYFDPGRKCKFSARQVTGFTNGSNWEPLGPFDPACEIRPNAAFADKPNPFRKGDFNPLTGGGGGLSLPYRPAPKFTNTAPVGPEAARGLWVPNAELSQLLREDKFADPPINFSQDDLAWNHGASQQDEKELKEAYFDLEMFDSRLWLRVGLQTIVWGKTELFRNQDQWNPQDFALSSLPGLEESRISLWALRGAWSFYEVGPLEDVRLELAVNYDKVEPGDLGDCGEPYAVTLICLGSFGFLSHGFEAAGIAGVRRPPDPWDSWEGVEAGARIEFRWERFSFALTDFYGFTDFPYIEKIFTFERNVDPLTGRPRRLNSRGRCKTGKEPECLGPDEDALLNHSANQTMYAKNCASTFGFIALDTAACGLTIFNSQNLTSDQPVAGFSAPRLSIALANVLSGQIGLVGGAIIYGGAPGLPPGQEGGLAGFTAKTRADLCKYPNVRNIACSIISPLVPLTLDPNDGGPPPATGDPSFDTFRNTGLTQFLTDEQEALLGCGPFYQTICDYDGIDLLNLEASVVVQSWVGFDGSFGEWDATDASVAQPGTVGFNGGPVCTRYENGRLYVLPGCRGPRDHGYDIRVDGSTGGARHPFTGQLFRSEMAIFSWNLMMALVGFSLPENPKRPGADEFNGNEAFRGDGCSFRRPQYCKAFYDFWNAARSRRSTIRAGGNGIYGRRDWQWHDGTPLAVRFEKRNIVGFSMDWAEDTFKSNWSLEFTWQEGLPMIDNNEYEGLTRADSYNLTVSVDRPTFINFLNANRTIFFNAQVFFQYIDGYKNGFMGNGPFNTLGVFTVTTGYFQDRLLPTITTVYDVKSNSGAFLTSLTYRISGNFSATFGVSAFFGRQELKLSPVNPISSQNRTGRHSDKIAVSNGLNAIRDRDEIFLTVRYTF